MKKRATAALLALCMVLSLNAGVFAEELPADESAVPVHRWDSSLSGSNLAEEIAAEYGVFPDEPAAYAASDVCRLYGIHRYSLWGSYDEPVFNYACGTVIGCRIQTYQLRTEYWCGCGAYKLETGPWHDVHSVNH